MYVYTFWPLTHAWIGEVQRLQKKLQQREDKEVNVAGIKTGWQHMEWISVTMLLDCDLHTWSDDIMILFLTPNAYWFEIYRQEEEW